MRTGEGSGKRPTVGAPKYSALRRQNEDDDRDENRQDEQRDLDPTQRMLPGHRAGVPVDHHLEGLRSVVVADQPDWHQDVLESLLTVVRAHLQVAMGVSRDLLGAKRLDLCVHLLAGMV